MSPKDDIDDWDDYEDTGMPLMLTCELDEDIEMDFHPNSIYKDKLVNDRTGEKGWGILRYDGHFDGAPVEEEEIPFWAKKAFIAFLKEERISAKSKKLVSCIFMKTENKKGLNEAAFRSE